MNIAVVKRMSNFKSVETFLTQDSCSAVLIACGFGHLCSQVLMDFKMLKLYPPTLKHE